MDDYDDDIIDLAEGDPLDDFDDDFDDELEDDYEDDPDEPVELDDGY